MADETALPTAESQVSWELPGVDGQVSTWYKTLGDLQTSQHLPVITLHGGPGAGHDYISPMADLYSKHGIPVVFYDQVGCCRSTHLREKAGDESFWTEDLFVQELDVLVDHLKLRERGFYLWGSSWGGMLAGAYACRRPQGLQKIVIASGPSNMPVYVKGAQQLLSELPYSVRKVIEDCDERGDYESEEYHAASAFFMKQHVCRMDPFPEDVGATLANLKDDPTVYMTMQGPSEFKVIGNLRDWEATSRAHNIDVETLLTNGRYDEAQKPCMEGWSQKIPKVEWVTFENSSHMAFWEERDSYMETVARFLTNGS